MPESRDVARRIAAEGPEGFGAVVRSCSPRLFRLALRMLGRASDAEDAVQDAFVRAYDALSMGRYDDRLRIDSWLMTIVTRVCLDSLRARKVRRPLVTEQNGEQLASLAAAGLGEDQALAVVELGEWLNELAPDQRAAVVLKFMEGMTSAEVAVVLGVSEGAVEQRILRARGTLRRRMESDGQR